jgi:hypothetical protein
MNELASWQVDELASGRAGKRADTATFPRGWWRGSTGCVAAVGFYQPQIGLKPLSTADNLEVCRGGSERRCRFF